MRMILGFIPFSILVPFKDAIFILHVILTAKCSTINHLGKEERKEV